jgi:hypothetical protein
MMGAAARMATGGGARLGAVRPGARLRIAAGGRPASARLIAAIRPAP